MKYEYSHKGALNTIKVLGNGSDKLRFIVRSEESKLIFEEMEILLSHNDIVELKRSLKDRKVGKIKIGKSDGIYRQYLGIERKNGNSPIVIVINKWFTFLGGCFGIELYREESSAFISALETAKF